jgi:hypothetical protein
MSNGDCILAPPVVKIDSLLSFWPRGHSVERGSYVIGALQLIWFFAESLPVLCQHATTRPEGCEPPRAKSQPFPATHRQLLQTCVTFEKPRKADSASELER